MNRYQRAYFGAFVLATVICWSPLNLLAYFAPALVLGWFLFMTDSGQTARRLLYWLSVWGVVATWSGLGSSTFVATGALATLFTYSAFAVVVAIPSSLVAGSELYSRMARVTGWVVLGEALLGFVQALYGYRQTGSFDLANGDYVEGTIHPQLAPELSLSNPMFAVNIAFMLIALFPRAAARKRELLFLLSAVVVLILASVVHVLIFLAAALGAAYLLYRPRVGRWPVAIGAALGMFTIGWLAWSLLRTNLGHLPVFAQLMLAGEYPRAVVVERVVTEAPREYPFMPLVGLGAGQFGSRAGLIATGMYFGGPLNPRPLPLVPTGMSEPFRTYALDQWLAAASNPAFGSTHQPFFSWLSVYTEFGVVVFCGLLLFVMAALVRVKVAARQDRCRLQAMALGAGVIFLFLLGLQENYWEVPQAILLGLMFLKVLYANLVHGIREAEAATGGGRTA